MAVTVETKLRPDPLVAEARTRVAPLVDRLLWERVKIKRSTLLFGEFCQGLLALGVPLDRATIHMPQIHPQLAARAMIWLSESGGAMETSREHGIEAEPIYLNSPIRRIYEGSPPIRRRLGEPDCPMDFPILEDLKPLGFTDYYICALPFATGRINAVGFASKRPGRFSDLDIAMIGAALPALGALMEMNHLRRTGQTLLQTYLGPKTGEKVLSGTIQRGDGEVINAVLWYCDLRSFTPLSESLPLDQVIALLNDYFECVAAPVKARGGEILKFIGDAMLAIFPLKGFTPEGGCAACGSAVKAAEEALQGIAALNERRAAASGAAPLRIGVAMARGDVMYGNIGDSERLDFTVIGPAVNLATRLEDLTRELDPPIVMSEAVAGHCGRDTRLLGRFSLKGIPEEQQAYTLA